MNSLKPTRQKLTSYYIAIIFSTMIIRMIPDQITTWVNWMISFFDASLNIAIRTEGQVWLCVLLVCYAIVWLFRHIIVEPLGFYINGDAKSIFEIVLLAAMVFGYLIYSVNQIFPEYSMPASIPTPILRVFDANKLPPVRSTEERNVLSIVPWLWEIGPIAVMYLLYAYQKLTAKDVELVPHSYDKK